MRLIDADELIEHVWRDKLDSRELIAKMDNNAPTVKEISTKIPITVFEQLISQEPKLKWIPVSERLPENSGKYWCTFGGTYLTGTDFYTTKDDAEMNFDELEEYAGWRSQNVIAWMPLPEPYKAGRDEE